MRKAGGGPYMHKLKEVCRYGALDGGDGDGRRDGGKTAIWANGHCIGKEVSGWCRQGLRVDKAHAENKIRREVEHPGAKRIGQRKADIMEAEVRVGG